MNILFKEYGECIVAVVVVIISFVMLTKVFSVISDLLQVSMKSFMG